MEAQEFDRLTRVRATGASRRGVVAGLGRGFVAALSLALIGSANIADADAKGKKKRKKKKKQTADSPVPPQDPQPSPPPPPSSPSPPSPPALQLAYECAPMQNDIITANSVHRIAQMFKPSQSGKLRQVQFAIAKEAGTTGDYHVQLVACNGGDPSASGNDVLALAVIPDSTVPVGDSILTANFDGPQLVGGINYAVAIKRLGEFIVRGHNENPGAACLGKTFLSAGGSDFLEYSSGNFDAIVSVFVE